MTTQNGAIRIFGIARISVFLHWTWFLMAAYEIWGRGTQYSSSVWNVAEYLAIFAIVTMHEFGHAFACRSVGGTIDRIVLWPLGGVAYVKPPERPGAWLWSIAAGPLVNVALLPVFGGLFLWGRGAGWDTSSPDLYRLVTWLLGFDAVMIVFNLLPIYPLDGGQIVRSLLWFAVGRAKSLSIAAIVGLAGAVGLFVLAVAGGDVWIGLIAAFVAFSSWGGYVRGRALGRLEAALPRAGFACPSCGAGPPTGAHWGCNRCRKPFDTFESNATCPHCAAAFPATLCAACGAASPFAAWSAAAPVASATTPPVAPGA